MFTVYARIVGGRGHFSFINSQQLGNSQNSASHDCPDVSHIRACGKSQLFDGYAFAAPEFRTTQPKADAICICFRKKIQSFYVNLRYCSDLRGCLDRRWFPGLSHLLKIDPDRSGHHGRQSNSARMIGLMSHDHYYFLDLA
jgi:hypothetical protein